VNPIQLNPILLDTCPDAARPAETQDTQVCRAAVLCRLITELLDAADARAARCRNVHPC